MNKPEIITELAKSTGRTKIDCTEFVDSFTAFVSDKLEKGETINLQGFGKFEVKKREPRMGRNPKTGEDIEIPSAYVPKFVPSSVLKDAVNHI